MLPGPDDVITFLIGYGSSFEDARETMGNDQGCANALANVVLGKSPEEAKRLRAYGMGEDIETRLLKSVGRAEAEYNDCFDGTLIHHGGLSPAEIASLQMSIFGTFLAQGVDISSDKGTLKAGGALMPVVDAIIVRQQQEIKAEEAEMWRQYWTNIDIRLGGGL